MIELLLLEGAIVSGKTSGNSSPFNFDWTKYIAIINSSQFKLPSWSASESDL